MTAPTPMSTPVGDRLRALIAAAGFVGGIGPALAADWARVPAAGVDQHYYDRSKVTVAGDEITYWRKVVFGKPVRLKTGVAKSALYRERMHCRDHTLRALSWQLYAEEGVVIESSTVAEGEAGSIVPETVGDRFQAVMCPYAEARKRQDADIARDEAQLAARRKELETLKAEVDRLEAALARMRDEATAMVPKPEPASEPASR